MYAVHIDTYIYILVYYIKVVRIFEVLCKYCEDPAELAEPVSNVTEALTNSLHKHSFKQTNEHVTNRHTDA